MTSVFQETDFSCYLAWLEANNNKLWAKYKMQILHKRATFDDLQGGIFQRVLN